MFTIVMITLFTASGLLPSLAFAENNLESPADLDADAVSSTQVDLSWDEPNDDSAAITGYKIEVKMPTSSSYDVLEDDTQSTKTEYSHTGLDPDTDYIYRVSAINSEGTSDPSREERAKTLSSDSDDDNDTSQNTSSSGDSADVTQNDKLKLAIPDKFTIEQGKSLSFPATLSQPFDEPNNSLRFSLDDDSSVGATINSSTGQFNWQTNNSHAPGTYRFDVVVSNGSQNDRQTVLVTIDEVKNKVNHDLSAVVDSTKQHSIDMFSNVVDKSKDPQYYVDRYNNEPEYKKWFDDNYSKYPSIYDAVGLENSSEESLSELKIGECGSGTELVDGMCIVIEKPKVKPWWQFW